MPQDRSDKKAHGRDVLSTKEAAVICKVALSTIVYWFDKGLIQGYRTPGGHRRIFRSDLVKFMHEHAMPLGRRLADAPLRVLVVARDPAVLGECQRCLDALDGRVDWVSAETSFHAGQLTSSFRPDVMVVEHALPELDSARICGELFHDSDTELIAVIAIADRTQASGLDALRASGRCAVLTKPLSRAALEQVLAGRLTD